MGEYLGIVCVEEQWGLSLMLQDYENYYYLRVENSGGAGILKCLLDADGKFVPSYERSPEDAEDFRCIQWAQNVIVRHNN